MKKILSVGLATMMALSLAACSSSNNAGTTTAAPSLRKPKKKPRRLKLKRRKQRQAKTARLPEAAKITWLHCATIPSEIPGGPKWNRNLSLRQKS